ncbi:MAG: hypothetical protein ABIE74_08675 [Pseudomonadota bacterium]
MLTDSEFEELKELMFNRDLSISEPKHYEKLSEAMMSRLKDLEERATKEQLKDVYDETSDWAHPSSDA